MRAAAGGGALTRCAGYFIDAPNLQGEYAIGQLYKQVAEMQNVYEGVNRECVRFHRREDAWKCFMAQYTMPFIRTPLFMVNSPYDTWQLANVLMVPWDCVQDTTKCNATEISAIQNFRSEFVKASRAVVAHPSNGAYMDSCWEHCQACGNNWGKSTVNGKSIPAALGDWYAGRTKAVGRGCGGDADARRTTLRMARGRPRLTRALRKRDARSTMRD